MNISGSNYLVHAIGDYGDLQAGSSFDEQQQAWYSSSGVQSVVGTYPQFTQRIEDQITDMYAHVQRRIVLPLTFANPFSGKSVHGHILVLGEDYKVRQEHISSLQSIIQHVISTGYDELTIRFGYVEMTAPFSENNFAAFYRYKDIIWDIHDAVDAVRGEFPVVYDLGMEKGGLDDTNNHKYVYWIWRHYYLERGADDTVGFSVSTGSNSTLTTDRLTRLWDTEYEDIKPPVQAIDCYDNITSCLDAVSDVIGNHPVVLQETYYNDYRAWHEARLSKANLTGAYQWQWRRGAGNPHLSEDYPMDYRYIPITQVIGV